MLYEPALNSWHTELAPTSLNCNVSYALQPIICLLLQSLTGPSDNMVPSDSRGFPAVPSKFLRYFGMGILYHHIAGCILRFVSVENL